MLSYGVLEVLVSVVEEDVPELVDVPVSEVDVVVFVLSVVEEADDDVVSESFPFPPPP